MIIFLDLKGDETRAKEAYSMKHSHFQLPGIDFRTKFATFREKTRQANQSHKVTQNHSDNAKKKNSLRSNKMNEISERSAKEETEKRKKVHSNNKKNTQFCGSRSKNYGKQRKKLQQK